MVYYKENGPKEDLELTLEPSELVDLIRGRSVEADTDSFMVTVDSEEMDLPSRLSLAQREIENAAFELDNHD